MELIVKYKFKNVNANGNSISLVPLFPSDVNYTTTDVVEGNITTRTIETDDLSKVTHIRFGCNDDTYVAGAWEYLTEILDINISYVDTFFRMFRGCKLLNKIDVSNWDTSNITNMDVMFSSCSALTQLDVSNWDISNVKYLSYMFSGCSALTQLDLSNWDMSETINMSAMFDNCKVENVGLIYCSKDTVDKLANCITSPCNFYVDNTTYTSPNSLVKYIMYREDRKELLYYDPETDTWIKPVLRQWDSIEKHSDGKYYYHKRSGEVVFNGSEKWVFAAQQSTTNRYQLRLDSITTSSILLCDKFKQTDGGTDNEGVSNHATSKMIQLTLKQDKGHATAWLQANNITVVYQLAEEKVYECTNLDLITYADETNLMIESGAAVPKTTLKNHQNIANMTTVLQEKVNVLQNDVNSEIDNINNEIDTHTEQIDNLNKELDMIKKLEKSAITTVTTESNYTTVEATSNGYFDDVKLEGKTLVNLWGNTSSDFDITGEIVFDEETQFVSITSTTHTRFANIFSKNVNVIKPNTLYTIIVDVVKNTFPADSGAIMVTSHVGDDTVAFYDYPIGIMGGKTGRFVYTRTTILDFSNVCFALRSYVNNEKLQSGCVAKFRITLLEGDHTQNPPAYFEGVKSVGDGVEEVSVESVKDNLIPNIKFKKGGSDTPPYDIMDLDNEKYRSLGDFIFLPKGEIYIDANRSVVLKFKDMLGNDVTSMTYVPFTFSNPIDQYVYMLARKNDGNWDLGEYPSDIGLTLTVGKSSNSYTPHQSNKKPLLYYDPTTETWEKPVLRQWDSIEKHSDGKYYYHKRSDEIVLNGSERWDDRSSNYTSDTQTRFSTAFSAKPCSTTAVSLICDKYHPKKALAGSATISENGISQHTGGSTLYITVPKTTLDEFKAELQSNQATVVYQLATEEVYECINIDLITYDGETNFIVNTGVIAPLSTLKVMCGINNVVRELQQKVSNLENYIQHVMIDALNNALNE